MSEEQQAREEEKTSQAVIKPKAADIKLSNKIFPKFLHIFRKMHQQKFSFQLRILFFFFFINSDNDNDEKMWNGKDLIHRRWLMMFNETSIDELAWALRN